MAPRLHLPAQKRRLAAAKTALRDLLSSYRSSMLLSLALLAITLGPTSSQAQTGCVPNTPNYPCVYVANQGSNSVSVINATSNGVIATIAVGNSPMGLAVTPDNAFVYVANNPVGRLGDAARFAVLAGSGVFNTGSTVITGDLGVSPGTQIIGFPPGIVNGTIHDADSVAAAAQVDAMAAYQTLAGLSGGQMLSSGTLDGLTFTPGLYTIPNSTQATLSNGATLTLDFQGMSNQEIIFQIPFATFGSLSTGSNSIVKEINQGQNDNVYWQVAGSAELGSGSEFVGIVLAEGSSGQGVVMGAGAAVNCGRALAVGSGSDVVMSTNTVNDCVSNTVSVIDTSTNTVAQTIAVNGFPTQIAITPDGAFAWVVETESSSIDVINTKTNQVVGMVTLTNSVHPTAITFTPDGAFAYLADTCNNNNFACAEVIDTATLKIVNSIMIQGSNGLVPASIAITPDGTLVCMSFETTDGNLDLNVAFISTTSNTVMNSLFVLKNAVTSNYGFGITPDGILYVAEQQDPNGVKYHSVARVNTATQQLLSPITVGNGPTGVAVGPNGALVYVTNEADNTLSVINTSTLAVFTTQAAFNNPQGVAAMSEGPPTITTQPASQTIGYGQSATLTVVATSPSPLSYQWYQGQSGDTSMQISGATGSSYTTPPLTLGTSYWVLVSNIAGSVPSNTATITVTQPFITSQPVSQTITANQTATLSVTAVGVQPLSYQWYKGQSGDTSMLISGATSFSYTTPPLISTTSYWVLVTNAMGSIPSNTAVITTQASAPVCGTFMLNETSPPPLAPTTSIQTSVTCTDPQGEDLTATINWGDGNTSNLGPGHSPLFIGLPHSYAAPGFYTLTVSATNTTGTQSTPVSSDLNLNLMSVSLFAGQSANLPVTKGVAVQPPLTLKFTCTTVIDSNGNHHLASDLGISCTSIPSPFSQLPVTLVITTTGGASGSVASEFRRRSWLFALWLPVWSLAFVGAGVKVAGHRKHGLQYLGLGTAIVLLLLFVSCASGGFQAPQTSTPPSGTPPGTYQVTVIDEVAPPGNSTGFVQTTLIVQLTVAPFQ